MKYFINKFIYFFILQASIKTQTTVINNYIFFTVWT
jgi:hypothetical protein